MKVNLEEVLFAMQSAGSDEAMYYVIPLEKIMSSAEVSGKYDESDLIRLPDRRDIDDYGNMERFIERVKDEEIQEWLSNAIRGRGAFRMFRAALDRFHMLNDWYDYRDRCHRVTAMEWCEDNGIEYEGNRYELINDDEEEEDDDYGFDQDYIEPEKPVIQKPVSMPKQPQYRIVSIGTRNAAQLVFLASGYRDEILVKKGFEKADDPEEAQAEIEEMLKKGYTVTAVSESGRYLGYSVTHEDGESLIMNELFVKKDMRRKGLGEMLISSAASDAEEKGKELKFEVDPACDEMLSLLETCGYITLQKLMISAVQPEENAPEITVGSHRFRKG